MTLVVQRLVKVAGADRSDQRVLQAVDGGDQRTKDVGGVAAAFDDGACDVALVAEAGGAGVDKQRSARVASTAVGDVVQGRCVLVFGDDAFVGRVGVVLRRLFQIEQVQIEFTVRAVGKGIHRREVTDGRAAVRFAVTHDLVVRLVNAGGVEVLDERRGREPVFGEAEGGAKSTVGADKSERSHQRSQRGPNRRDRSHLDDLKARPEVIAFRLGWAFPIAALDVEKECWLMTGAHKQRAAFDSDRQPLPKGWHDDKRPGLVIPGRLAHRRPRMDDEAIEAVPLAHRGSSCAEGLEVEGIQTGECGAVDGAHGICCSAPSSGSHLVRTGTAPMSSKRITG